eukprot:TRINITY_DN3998_c0_g6_i1.p1 TRINITY_DN3998_c0_g6~~TRINITY_DN3998_c0_g6_i1.p1  ORF type:complete len:275 (+),score=60.23 TRINITY_DN3998_c0_g6_i1:47-871(+)
MVPVILLLISVFGASVDASKKVHYVHWNRDNPLFAPGNSDHVLTVNEGNLPWEYDQVNIICPVSKRGSRYPETHVIYSVSKEEYDSCRISNPKPRIVAVCNDPYKVLYFTITFRSFTPTPGGLEFKPGASYYFISTSSHKDLHRRVGGGCATNNMRMIFKVARNDHFQSEISQAGHKISTSEQGSPPLYNQHRIMYDSRIPSGNGEDFIYYYHPRDLVNMEEKFKRKLEELEVVENEIWSMNEEALRLTSASRRTSIDSVALIILPFFVIKALF